MTTFYAVPIRNTRVRVIFSEPMQKNSALVNRMQYVVNDLTGASISVLSVTAEQASGVVSTLLDLGIALVSGRLYQIRVNSQIVSDAEGQPVQPNTQIIQWTERELSVEIPLQRFSGEVSGGLYGDEREAQVFFSPALEASAQGSVIQLDQVDVCTRADDKYILPPQLDAFRPLMVHAYNEDGTLVPLGVPATTLNATDVLWVPGYRVDPSFAVGWRLSETMPAVTESTTVTISTWPAARASILNDPSWKLYDNLGGSYFITADNLTPLPLDVVTVIL